MVGRWVSSVGLFFCFVLFLKSGGLVVAVSLLGVDTDSGEKGWDGIVWSAQMELEKEGIEGGQEILGSRVWSWSFWSVRRNLSHPMINFFCSRGGYVGVLSSTNESHSSIFFFFFPFGGKDLIK